MIRKTDITTEKIHRLKLYHLQKNKNFERDRTRTCNPQIRSLGPYPLGHTPYIEEENYNKLKNLEL